MVFEFNPWKSTIIVKGGLKYNSLLVEKIVAILISILVHGVHVLCHGNSLLSSPWPKPKLACS